MFKCRTALLLSSGVAALLVSTQAFAAQDASQAATASVAAAQENEGDVIVVTATKREEAILDIPQSVTVVGGETLERQAATTFQQYLNEIPGLSINEGEPGETRLTLRGVNTGGVSSTVAVYVDEMPFGSSTALVNGAILTGDIDPFDLQRIEVLRGPQGTLYGANSLGGIFKYVTTPPKLGDLSGRARAGIEFMDEGGTGYYGNGLINAPLGDNVAVRASGFYRKRAGWIDATPRNANIPVPTTSLDDDNINDNKSYGGRASVLFKPTDELSIRLTAYLQNLRTHASSGTEVDPENFDFIHGDYGTTVFVPEFSHIKYRIYNATVDYDFGFATLLSATSYGKLNTNFRTDLTLQLGGLINTLVGPFSPFPGGAPVGPPNPFPLPWPVQVSDELMGVYQNQLTGVKKFTQEVRLASPSNDVFEWMLGAYYTKEDGIIDQHINGVVLDDPDFDDGGLADLIFGELSSDYKEIAGFANATWHVTDRFDISAGARLSGNDQTTDQFFGGPIAPFQFGGAQTDDLHGESDETVFTYSVSPRFELSDNSAVYARIAKGYRPGGPNAVPPLPAPLLADFPTTFEADTLTSYELGYKADFGRRLSVDLAAYHLSWDNIQLFGQVSGFGFNHNGEGARVNGLEGTVSYRPTRGLNLSANGAWIDAELTDDTPAIVGGHDGDTLPFTPTVSFGLNADYEWALSGLGEAYVGGSFRFTGDQKGGFQPGGAAQRDIDAYATLDLRAGVDFGTFSVEAYARNLTDGRGITALGGAGSGIPDGGIEAAFIQPRTIGLSLTAGF